MGFGPTVLVREKTFGKSECDIFESMPHSFARGPTIPIAALRKWVQAQPLHPQMQ